MSFIHDALKKTQKNLHPTQNQPQNAKENVIAPERPQNILKETQLAKSSKSKKIILLRLLILIFIIFIINNFYLSKKHPPKSQKIKKILKNPIISTNPASQQSITPKLTLSGIMMIDNQYVALINDEIHRVGDIVNTGKILEITLEKVVWELNGEEITLMVGQKY
jgi:hypothetical protein